MSGWNSLLDSYAEENQQFFYRIEALEARNAKLVALLKSISEWDMMDTAADGPFWRREIATALADQPLTEKP